jgi:hypothetical protein
MTAKTMILIENLSPFLHCYEMFKTTFFKDLFIVYLGGMPTRIQSRLLQNLAEKNNFEKIIIWVDHDFGGLRIANFIVKKLRDFLPNISIEYPPTDIYCIPYRTTLYKKIMRQIENEPEIIKEFGESIIKRGEFEQELFMSEFIEKFFDKN